MTMTEDRETTETTDETPDNVIVAEPRPVAAGDVVVKTAFPQVYDGLVLDVVDGKAYVIGRREEGGPWTAVAADASAFVRRDTGGDSPGYKEIAAALIRFQEGVTTQHEQQRLEVANANARAMAAENVLTTFKTRVRDQAISFVVDNSYDVDYLNSEFLEPLGLDAHTTEWDVYVDVTGIQRLTVRVQANSESEAYDAVTSDDVHSAITSYDWEVDDWNVDRDTDADPVT